MSIPGTRDFHHGLLGLAFMLTMAWRGVYIRVFTREQHRYCVAVIGTGPAARLIAGLLRRMAPHTAVVAFVGNGVSELDEPLGLPAVSGAEGLRSVVAKQHVSELVLAPPGKITPELLRAVVNAQESGVEVVRMATVYERLLRRIPIDHLESDWVITSLVDAMRFQDASRLAKRVFDILAGCVGCVAFLLLLPILGPAIWLDTGRPILFWQERVGLANRPFRLLKFRTMEQGAERDGPRWAGNPRSARNAARSLSEAISSRRGSAVLQRGQGRHKPGRTAARASGVRRGA